MRLIEILQSLRQNFPLLKRYFLASCAIGFVLITLPVKSDLFSPRQEHYENLYRGRKEAVSKAHFLIEQGWLQMRENMLVEAEESFKEAIRICQTQGLRECERDALDGWGEVLEALGQHKRERLLRQLQQSYTFSKKDW